MRSLATSVAMRRAAASRKWPEPAAGSQTFNDSSASALSAFELAEFIRSPITGARALSISWFTSSGGV